MPDTLPSDSDGNIELPLQQECNSLDYMPPELIEKIVSFLPTYAAVGKNPIGATSKAFDNAARHVFFQRKSINQIINECKSEEDALNILKDESLFEQLKRFSFDELLEIVSFVPSIAIEVLHGNYSLSGAQVVMLARHSLSTAEHILSAFMNRDSDVGVQVCVAHNVDIENIITLGQFHVTIAEKILDDKRLDGLELIRLAESHLSIAQKIFDTETLYNKIGLYHLYWLAESGNQHLYIAELILNQNAICNKLNGAQLALLGQNHLSIAARILANPTLCDKLDGKDLALLGQNHLSIAAEILDRKSLCVKLNGKDLACLGRYHLSIAAQILDTKKLLDKLNGDDLVLLSLDHLSIAERILDTKELCDKLDGKVAPLGENHLSIAERILDTKELCDKLDGEVALLGLNHLSIAERILDTKELLDKLNGDDLVLLSQNHLSIAERILDTKELLDKLDGSDLSRLGQNHLSIAERILSDEKLRKKIIWNSGISHFRGHNIEFTKRIIDQSLNELINDELHDHDARCKLVKDLCRIALKHPEVAHHLLKPAFYQFIDARILLSFGESHLSVAERILNEAELFNILKSGRFPDNLIRLGDKHISIAERLLNEESLRGMISEVIIFANGKPLPEYFQFMSFSGKDGILKQIKHLVAAKSLVCHAKVSSKP